MRTSLRTCAAVIPVFFTVASMLQSPAASADTIAIIGTDEVAGAPDELADLVAVRVAGTVYDRVAERREFRTERTGGSMASL